MGKVEVLWDRNTETDISHYRVLFGVESGNYAHVFIATDTTLSFYVDPGSTYFAVTAVDLSGNESLFSEEVVEYIPDTRNPAIGILRLEGDVLPSDGIDLFELTSALIGDNSSVMIEKQGSGFKVTAMGRDFWQATDDGSFLYMTAQNDFEFTLKIQGMSNPHEWAKAGLMIRKDLTPGSKMGYVFATPQAGRNQIGFIWRSGTNAEIKIGNMKTATYPLVEIKIQRIDSDIEAYHKENGQWILIDRQEVILPSTVLVGVATCSISTVTPVEVLYSGFVKL